MKSTLTDRISLTFRVLTSSTVSSKEIEVLPFSITHERIQTVKLESIEQGGQEDDLKIAIVTFIVKLDDEVDSDGLESIICWMQYELEHKDVYGISHADADLLETSEL